MYGSKRGAQPLQVLQTFPVFGDKQSKKNQPMRKPQKYHRSNIFVTLLGVTLMQ